MGLRIDLTGQQFDYWHVDQFHGRSASGLALWDCTCKCGTKKVVYGNNLRRGGSKSCGCKPAEGWLIDQRSRRLGDWFPVEIDTYKPLRWKCRCVCGKIKSVLSSSLLSGASSSCGCAKDRKNDQRLIDKWFGRIFVVSRNGSHNWRRIYNCICWCGTRMELTTHQILTYKSCGCLAADLSRMRGEMRRARWMARGENRYIIVRQPGHPNARASGDIPEHILVMSNYKQRPLEQDEEVHHANGIKYDNRIENLELWIKSHPAGQRVNDVIRYALEMIERYPEEASKIRKQMDLEAKP